MLSIPHPVRLLLSIAGTAFLISTALIIDWLVDSFSNEEWNEIDEIMQRVGDSKLNRGFNFFIARTKLFYGAYLFVSASIAIVTFIMLWLIISQIEISNPLFATASWLFPPSSGGFFFLR